MILNFDSQKPQNKAFSLVLAVRDHRTGEPTGKTVSIEADNGDELYEAYIKHTGVPKKKKKEETNEAKKQTTVKS